MFIGTTLYKLRFQLTPLSIRLLNRLTVRSVLLQQRLNAKFVQLIAISVVAAILTVTYVILIVRSVRQVHVNLHVIGASVVTVSQTVIGALRVAPWIVQG